MIVVEWKNVILRRKVRSLSRAVLSTLLTLRRFFVLLRLSRRRRISTSLSPDDKNSGFHNMQCIQPEIGTLIQISHKITL